MSIALVSVSAFAPPWHGIPKRTVASPRKNTAGDPVNIAIEGSQSQIQDAFLHVGWRIADPLSIHNDIKLALASINDELYPTAPVSNLYLFGRPEDFAVELEGSSVAQRDHARFWDTGVNDPATKMEIWIGDASRDIAIEIRRSKNHFPIGTTHRIEANVDLERDFIARTLENARVVVAHTSEPGMGATTNGRNGSGDRFVTDGKVVVLELR